MRKTLVIAPAIVVAAAATALAPYGCTSSTPATAADGGGGDGGPAGGPVSGAPDTHCGTTVQSTSAASCHPDAGPPGDAGATDDGGTGSEFKPTMYNTEADDDDCKYHLSWTSTPIRENTDVTFTVKASNKTDKSPLTPPAGYAGDPIRAEVFLDETHPAPNSGEKGAMTSPGSYTAGPIHFDKPGRWTVRFHFFEDCDDTVDDSPHGHAAFYVDVP
jgi:hypothetical protein